MEKLPLEASPVYKLVRQVSKYIFKVTTSRKIGQRLFSYAIPYIVEVLEDYTALY